MVIIPLGTLLLCIAALFYQMHTANEMLAAVHLADQRIRQTTELQSLITDEESGVRGYQITPRPGFPGALFSRQGAAAGRLWPTS